MATVQVTIVGGGFGGVYTARHLLRRGIKVRLISRDDFFTFTPLLHEVATGTLEPSEVAFPFSTFFTHKNFEFIQGEVASINSGSKIVRLGNGQELTYEVLVLATGSVSHFYGIEGAEDRLTLKTVHDALAIKKALASHCYGRPLRLNVIGGGFTGVELVCEISQVLARHDWCESRITLINDSGTPFERSYPQLAGYIANSLKKLNIQFKSHFHAERLTEHEIIGRDEALPSDVTIVTTGVKPSTSFLPADILDERGNVMVDYYLRVKDQKDMFALGDIIALPDSKPPALAQTAVMQAKIVAANIAATAARWPLKPYEVRLKGLLVSLGTWNAVGTIFSFTIRGRAAWYMWRTVYLFKTPGFRNKARIAYRWTTYLFARRKHFRI